MASKKKRDEADLILRMFNNKSDAVEYMQEKAQKHNARALQKIMLLQSQKGYEESLEVEREIDSEFLQSVKAKLQCL